METPIRVYTPYLDLKMEVDNYSSLQLSRDYHGVGKIELHINHYVHGADSIKKGDIISLGDSQEKVGIIRSREISLTEEGKESEEWAFEAVTLQGLMQQRITVPPKGKSHDRKSGPAEEVMKHYVRRNFVDPADSKREIKYLVIADDKGRGKDVKRESRYKNVADELEDMSKESGLGWMVYADYARRKFVFDVYEGLDLTQGNEEGNDPVFFSPEFGTIKSQDFSDSDLDMSNFGYIGGPGEGEDRYVIELGEETGLNRFESFVDARDVSDEYKEDDEEYDEDADTDSDDNKRPDEEIEADLEERGKSKMEEKMNELSLEAEILSPTTRQAYEWQHEGYVTPVQPYGHYEKKEQQITPFVYERDFDLGDIVPVYNRNWGVTMTAPITKIKEIHEPGGFRLDATFGKERPTLVSKIQDEFNEINGIDKQEAAAVMVSRHGKNVDKRLTEEQKERLEQAQENLDEARGYTEDYAEKKVHVGDDPPEDTDKKWLDTSGSHDKWRRYNHDSDADNEKDKWETDDVIDKDTTFADEWLLARHIESLNGLTVGGGQFEVDDSGNVYFAGKLRGAVGEFSGTVKGGKIETIGKEDELGESTKLVMEAGYINGKIDKGNKTSIREDIEEDDQVIIEMESVAYSSDDSDDLIDKDELKKNTIVNLETGDTEDVDADLYTTDYIDVSGGATYESGSLLLDENIGVAFYDEDKDYVNGTQDEDFETPSESAYLRATIEEDSLDDAYIKKDFGDGSDGDGSDGDDEDGGEDDGDDDNGDDEDDSANYDTSVVLSPNSLSYEAGDYLTSVLPNGMDVIKTDGPRTSVKSDGVELKSQKGIHKIYSSQGDGRSMLIVRSDKRGKKSGSNLYLYGNDDSSLPGAFRLFDGSKRGELLRGYKGLMYSYAPIKAKTKYMMEATKQNSLIHMPYSGEIRFVRDNGTEVMSVRGGVGGNDARSIRLPGLEYYTTSSEPDVHISSHYNLKRVNSSRKTKANIKDVDIDPCDDFLDKINGVSFESKNPDEEGQKFYGFIAEDMDEVDELLTKYNSDGEPDGVAYTRVPVMHHRILQSHKERINDLEKENKDLKERLEKLEEKLAY